MKNLAGSFFWLMFTAILASPVFALNNQYLDLDVDEGHFSEWHASVDHETSVELNLKCTQSKLHETWKPTFGIHLMGDARVALLRFRMNSPKEPFFSQLIVYEGDKAIDIINLKKPLPLNKEIHIRCSWSENRVVFYLNGELLNPAINLEIKHVKITCSTANIIIRNLNFI